jgi:putative Holliday junction resolvase
LGYPTKMSGEKTEWTYTVEKFANSLESTFPNVKVILQDERMTTITATSFLKEDLGIKMSKIKKIKDKMSSVVILNEYLESMKKNKN